MKPLTLTLLFLCLNFVAFGQNEQSDFVKGKVLNAANDKPLSNVSIINLTQILGTSTDDKGNFKIKAAVGDTLYFSYLGFKSIQVGITEDWKKYGDVKVKMTEIGFTLETVTIKPVKLTGYLEIDAKNIPLYDNYRYRIQGLNSGYEAGTDRPGAFSKTLSAIFNPLDFLHNAFGKRGRQMRKLREMKKNDEIRRLLDKKFDRETLAALLHVNKKDINKILSHCNYSRTFIKNANDLQILEAISACYENYKALKEK